MSLCQGPDKHGVVTSGACWLVTNAPLGNLDAPTDRFSYPRLENTGNMGNSASLAALHHPETLDRGHFPSREIQIIEIV